MSEINVPSCSALFCHRNESLGCFLRHDGKQFQSIPAVLLAFKKHINLFNFLLNHRKYIAKKTPFKLPAN